MDKIDKNEGSICQFDLYHGDCIEFMSGMAENSVDFTLTDIPYGVVNNYGSAGDEKAIRKLNKGAADIVTFTLDEFLPLVHKVTGNSVCVFCGKEQFSQIFDYFASQAGTTRAIVWDKTNPSPLGGQYDDYVTIVIYSIAGNDIYYTMDGTVPDKENGIPYPQWGISLNRTGNFEINAVC